MFGINALNPASLLATAALGPAGGLMTQFATQIFSRIGQQVLQQMGQQLGLPQSAIDMAQASFAGANGDIRGLSQNANQAIEELGNELRASPADVGQAQADAKEALDRVLNDLSQSDDVKDAKAGGRGKGWLMALAKVLGAKMDDLADKMGTMAHEISDGAASKSSEFTVLAQEFGLVMNAATTSIKTIGEAMNNMARKQ